MYRCENCEYVFEEPQYIPERERIDYGIGAVWMTIYEYGICPECESTNYEEYEEPEENVGLEEIEEAQ